MKIKSNHKNFVHLVGLLQDYARCIQCQTVYNTLVVLNINYYFIKIAVIYPHSVFVCVLWDSHHGRWLFSLDTLKRLMFVMDARCFCEVGIQFWSTYSAKSMLQNVFGISHSIQCPTYEQGIHLIVSDFRKFYRFFLFSAAVRRTWRETFCVKGSQGSFSVGKVAGSVKLITYPQLALRLTL